jgi:SAM-dependent methyltransferase
MLLSDVRYLLAKRTVDDRSLCLRVFDIVRRRIADRDVKVLELGGGCGTMVDRLLQGGALRRAEYVLLDQSAPCLAHARECAAAWARGDVVHPSTDWPSQPREGAAVAVRTVEAELERWLLGTPEDVRFDLVICNAVLDLVDLSVVVPAILRRLSPSGLLWATVNFDGDTIFTPDDPDDAPILAAYHHSMDVRTRDGRPAGDSRSGRHLFGHLRDAGGTIHAAGASDWVVYGQAGRYPAEEGAFLHHIIATIEAELGAHADVGSKVGPWAARRHAQIDAGELVYVAHQLDFVAGRQEGARGG